MPQTRPLQLEKEFTCLVIGPTASGKSCFLKSLPSVVESIGETTKNSSPIDKGKLFSTTLPTVGTELLKLQIPTKLLASSTWSKRFRCRNLTDTLFSNRQNLKLPSTCTVNLREVGGSLQALWPRYFEEASAVCLVVDASNLLSPCGGSGMSMLSIATILANEKIRRLPIALCLSKVDGEDEPSQDPVSHLPSASELAGIADILFSTNQLFQARSQYSDYDVTICTSAKTNSGLVDFLHWLMLLLSVSR